MKKFIYFIFVAVLLGCSSSKEIYLHPRYKNVTSSSSEVEYSLLLLGDVGDSGERSKDVLSEVHNQLNNSNPNNSGIIFLGDNIYPSGLRSKKHPDRKEDEERINNQLNILKGFDGEIFFIPGNHDWDHHGDKGWKSVKRQEKYIEEYLNREDAFLPNKGCPGPEVVKLSDGLVLIIIDSQWLLHPFRKPEGEKDKCDVRNSEEFLFAFKEVLKKNRNKQVIVAAHHPMYSNGNHGGKFRFKDHIFPLTAVKEKAYIPMPIIGSIYPFYRKFLGHRQDIAHPVYQEYINRVSKAMNEYDNVVFISGHEHNLQYSKHKNIHHVISGSGSKKTHLRFNNQLQFGARKKGFSKINYLKNGEFWLEFYCINDKGESELSYRELIFTKNRNERAKQPKIVKTSYKDQFKTVIPDSTYEASALKRFFFGNMNRDTWTKSLTVPYLDIHYVKGGLSPIKKGGGMQTLSLRMLGGDGKQYVLRGIKKNANFLTERELRGTIAQDIIYDGMSGSHPYASVVVPYLSKEAGIYYAQPKLVFVPDDPILGDYQDEFGGMFCLFEERPNDDMSAYSNFGNSEKVMSYSKVLEKLHKSSKHYVDIDYVVKARLFDMLIGDWDRHDDQWRWARFKDGERYKYRPIPRDRDQVFFQFDGVIPTLTKLPFLQRKFQPFTREVKDIRGLNFNARYFDRSYLTQSTADDWQRMAQEIQTLLTDEIIESAINEFPDEAFEISGDRIIQTLKDRRDNLQKTADDYYKVLAKEVSIVGKLKKDLFEVERHANGDVTVRVFSVKKEEKTKKENKPYFTRRFKYEETKELRLYGLKGKDKYHIKGKSDKSILVRIIGGFKEDYFIDESEVSGLKKHTKIYETDCDNVYEIGKETKIIEKSEVEAFDYDRKDFVYDKIAPAFSLGFNANDGFIIGPGIQITKQGFKKFPFQQRHTFKANYTSEARGFNLYYKGEYSDVIKDLDFVGNFELNNPLSFRYHQAGNEIDLDQKDEQFEGNIIFLNRIHVRPALIHTSKSGSQKFNFGLKFSHIGFERLPFELSDYHNIGKQMFLGSQISYQYKNMDKEIYPTRGLKFNFLTEWNNNLSSLDVNYLKLESEMSIYLPLHLWKKQTTVNFRLGGSHIYGDYAFFQANFLNGLSNFRGIDRNRLSGRSSLYQNTDLRFSLLKFRNYIAPFDVGVYAHADIARVFQDHENSSLWHNSFGGGVFVNVLESFMLVGTYSVSDIDETFIIGTNFFF
jgi:hypothetical protein